MREHYRSRYYYVNDVVCISSSKRVIQRGYEGGWTLKLFKISRISSNRQPPVYYLRDLADEDITDYLYEELN